MFLGVMGLTLALIYAQHHPDRVQVWSCGHLHVQEIGIALVLSRRCEPHLPRCLCALPRPHSEAERSNLIHAYYARLTSEDVEVRRAAAKEWTRWEMATSRLFPDPEYLDKAEDLDFAVAFARIECHYFINAIFVEEAYILKHVDSFNTFLR